MRKHMSVLLSLVLVTTMFAGCAKKTNENTTAATGAEASQKEIATKVVPGDETIPNAAKNRTNAKDTLVVGMSEAKGDFLPLYNSTTYDGQVVKLVFDTLYDNDESGNYNIPRLAESYELSNENKTYTFKLNKNAKWSDGKPVTAKDIENTFLWMADKSYDGRYMTVVDKLVGYEDYRDGKAKTFEGVKVIDDYTVAFNCKDANVTNFANVASFPIMPAHVYPYVAGGIQKIKDQQAKVEIVGSGRYMLTKFVPKQYIEFKANPNWFGGKVNVPNIIIKFTTPDNQFQELQAGNTDIQTHVPAKAENEAQIKEIGFVSMNIYPGNSYGYMGFNLRDERLADVKVRQALTYGFNRQAFIDLYYNGNGTVCNAPISQVSWAFTNDINQYAYNPDTANKMLDEAGWVMGSDGIREKNGKKLSFIWDTYTDSKYVETMIPMIKADWQKIGVKIEPNLMEFNALVEKVYTKREFDMYNMAWSLTTDPTSRDIFHSAYDVPDGNNSIGLRDAEIDRLSVEAELEFDQAKRTELMHAYAKKINELLPYMFIGQSDEWDLSNVRVKNFTVSPYCDWTSKIEQVELAQ